MSFDQNSDLPIVDLHKKTTKVNVGIISGVLLFFIIAGAVIFWISRNEFESNTKVDQKAEESR